MCVEYISEQEVCNSILMPYVRNALEQSDSNSERVFFN